MLDVISKEKLEVNEVSAYLVNTPECHFSDTFDGNMKLQKLLTFANLIHYAQNNDFLFENEMYAFKNGIVVEDVRIPYHKNFKGYMSSLESYTASNFTEKQLDSINMSIALFNKLNARELSNLQHELLTWKIRYENSLIGTRHEKSLGKINRHDIISSDIEKIKKMINSYNSNQEEIYSYEEVNGIIFYYNESEIPLNKKQILEYLELVSESEVSSEDDTFFLAFDKEQGLYHY